MFNQFPKVEEQRYHIGRTSRLDAGEVHENGIRAIEVTVDTEGAATAQIDVLLPPIGHVVRGPPALEDEVPLQLLADGLLELLGQALHSRIVVIIQQRSDTAQIPRHRVLHRGERQSWQGALETVQSWLVPAGEYPHHGHPQHGGQRDTATRGSGLVHPALVHKQELQGVPHGEAYREPDHQGGQERGGHLPVDRVGGEVFQYPISEIEGCLIAGEVQAQGNGRNQPEALNVRRIDTITHAVLQK